MKSALVLSALLSGLPSGFAPSSLEPVSIREPVPVLMQAAPPLDAQTVALAPLLDRHLATTDSFTGAGGTVLIAGTLDASGDGFLAATAPGAAAHFFKIERGMSGTFSDGVHLYRVGLSVNIFRPRLANFIQIRDTATGQLVWEKRINELFRLAYRAGEPVNLAGRPYRLFYSARPALGLCFIYDDVSGGAHDFKFYMVPLEQIQGASPASYRMFGGDVVKLHVTPDLSTLQITR